ncbi:MAG: hypothetical protein AB1635_02915 [Acidobacteriota bacterium]
MIDAGIGRLLVASLHQGIAEVAPTRLEFYENWLSPEDMRNGRLGLAPLGAVLSFLRREGPETYEAIMTRAGTCAADWTQAGRSELERGLVDRLPTALRARAALRRARHLVRETFQPSRPQVRYRKGTGTVELGESIFCGGREPMSAPTCVYYAAAVGRLLTHFDVDAAVAIEECRGAGGPACRLAVSVLGARPAGEPAAA